MKSLFVCLLTVLFLSAHSLEADNSIKSRLDAGGGFYNRIRIEDDFFRISLNSLFSGRGFDWIEPAFKSDPFILGRLNLKGIIRECSNPDSLTSEAGVLRENAGITVTDSFSRSSRYGGALSPFVSPDVLLWFFLSNEGLFNAGVLLHELEPAETLLPSWMKFETDLLLDAGDVEGTTPGSWFSDRPLMPGQLVLIPAAEIRLIAGETGKRGRNAMRLSSEPFTAALSLLGSYSIPQYTECGGLYRIHLVMGNKALSFNAMFQAAEPYFISANGKQVTNRLSAGAGLCFYLENGIAEIETSCSYNYKLRNAEIIPSRYLEQTETMGIDAGVTISDIFKTKVDWEFERTFSVNGIEELSSSADLELSLSGLPVSFGIEFNLDMGFSEAAVIFDDTRCCIEAGFNIEPVDCTGSLSLSGDEVRIKTLFELSLDALRLKASVSSGIEGITELGLEVTAM